MSDQIFLLGSGECKIDDKGRIIFPSTLRKELKENFEHDKRVFVTMITPGEIRIYPYNEWLNTMNQVMRIRNSEVDENEKNKAFSFLLLSNKYGEKIDLDKQHRITIPKKIRDRMNLKGTVEIIGMGNHFKVYTAEKSEAIEKEIHEKYDFSKIDY